MFPSQLTFCHCTLFGRIIVPVLRMTECESVYFYRLSLDLNAFIFTTKSNRNRGVMEVADSMTQNSPGAECNKVR